MEQMQVALFASIKRSPFIVIVQIGQNHALGVPGYHFLRNTAFYPPRTTSFLCIEYINKIRLTTGSHILTIVAHANSLVRIVEFVVKNPLTDNIRNAQNLHSWIFWSCGECLVVAGKRYISNSWAMSNKRVSQAFECLCAKKRYWPAGAST